MIFVVCGYPSKNGKSIKDSNPAAMKLVYVFVFPNGKVIVIMLEKAKIRPNRLPNE